MRDVLNNLKLVEILKDTLEQNNSQELKQQQSEQVVQPLLLTIETGVELPIDVGIAADNERFGIPNEYGQIMLYLLVLEHHKVYKLE